MGSSGNELGRSISRVRENPRQPFHGFCFSLLQPEDLQLFRHGLEGARPRRHLHQRQPAVGIEQPDAGVDQQPGALVADAALEIGVGGMDGLGAQHQLPLQHAELAAQVHQQVLGTEVRQQLGGVRSQEGLVAAAVGAVAGPQVDVEPAALAAGALLGGAQVRKAAQSGAEIRAARVR